MTICVLILENESCHEKDIQTKKIQTTFKNSWGDLFIPNISYQKFKNIAK